MATARIDEDRWVRCPFCRHKLGRVCGEWSEYNSFPALEVKCGSCKKLSYIMVGNTRKTVEADERQ